MSRPVKRPLPAKGARSGALSTRRVELPDFRESSTLLVSACMKFGEAASPEVHRINKSIPEDGIQIRYGTGPGSAFARLIGNADDPECHIHLDAASSKWFASRNTLVTERRANFDELSQPLIGLTAGILLVGISRHELAELRAKSSLLSPFLLEIQEIRLTAGTLDLRPFGASLSWKVDDDTVEVRLTRKREPKTLTNDFLVVAFTEQEKLLRAVLFQSHENAGGDA